ncbi:MAG TPA: penicillin acylase family protein, partial [Spirochaetota bacterium]|nr:penicillin acylase family protein [Spirochaetota bacterium]
YRLNRASDWESFRAALRTFRALSQNIAYADVKGNIGIFCAAAIPIRKKGDGMGLVPGWTDEYEWSGFVPFEQQPFLYNPPSGMVISANNRTSPTFPHYISRWYYPPYRYDRIHEMIKEKDRLTVEDYTRMHNDKKSALVTMMKPGILAVVEKLNSLNDVELKALDLLRQWDGTMDRESAAAALFEQFYYEFIVNTFRDRMGQQLFEDYASERVTIAYAIEQLWGNHDSGWFDDPATRDRKETFDDVVIKSFRGAVSRLEGLFSGNTKRWRWGEMHTLTLKHPLGSVAVLDMLLNLNRGPYQVGGSYHTVCPYSYKPGKPFKSDDGASQRHAYDLADWDKSLTVIPTGISGIAGSRHYCDQTDLYINGRYHPDYFSKEKVRKNAAYTMKFLKK